METRKVIVRIREFSPAAGEVIFVPRLAASDGEVLPSRPFVCTTDAEGYGEVELPVKSSGTIRYQFIIRNPEGGKNTGVIELEAGEDIDLSELIAGSPAATESVRDYVDEKLAAAVPYKVFRGLISQSGSDTPTVTELENTIGEITVGRYGAGRYGLERTGSFTEKTFVRISGGYVPGDPEEMPARRMTAWRYNSGLIAILITDMTGSDADLNATAATVEVLVYED